MDKFKEWFVSQYFYTNMRFVHGDALFDKDGDFFRILAVQIAWEAWQSRQSEFDSMTEALLNQTQLLAKKQAEVDALKNLLEKDEHAHNLYYENANLQTLVEEKDKRIEEALNHLNDVRNKGMDQSCYLAIKALRGEHEA